MRMVSFGGPGMALAVLLTTVPVSAQVVAPPAAPQPGAPVAPAVPPAPQDPAAPGGVAPVGPPPVLPVAPLPGRTFTAPTGVIFNAVRPERVVDFELVVGYLQAALEKSTSPQVRAQSQGWRMFKATEPGPNGTVLYVFLFDPTVVGADYALGPILSDAYPDLIEPIWKLYQGALAGAGSQTLLNLAPVEPPPLPPPGVAPVSTPVTRPAPPSGAVPVPPAGTVAPLPGTLPAPAIP